ncbi:hypothetical protein FF38_13976 [Lucilia cuprina]|uniref:Single domain-containing protein n=1 Tax=Lucilia cuprina TaxID=7375 RepID=A0A0L0CCJ6_LUCCU|nr:hypothetical protein CVS40_11711 [Lucilia cuprina]KNC30158.1 hypothetical protein FF38_13976 [Lucilia cuprina]
MKFILLLAIALAGICCTQAAVYTEKYFRDQNYPGKCVVAGKVLNPGQSIKHPTMDCAEVTCDNSIGMATIETCDPISALASPLEKLKDYDRKNPPKCTWGDFKNTKALYPKCCERHFTCVF